MFLFSYLFILQAVSMTVSYDIELQGILKLGSDFNSGLGNSVNTDKHKPNSIFVRTKDKLPKKFSRSFVMRAASVGNNRTDDLLKYVQHIKKKGVKTLQETGNHIMKYFGSKKNITHHVDNVTEEYVMTMQNYTEYIVGKKAEVVIDEEFALLDMVETACRVIYRDQKKILNKALMTVNSKDDRGVMQNPINNSLIPEIEQINQIIFRQSIKTKRAEMQYICFKFEICRYYPALTDYIADFIVEIRKLSDDRLNTFIDLMKILMEVNADFFKTLCEKEDMDNISKQLGIIFKKVHDTHNILSVLRSVLTQRFKIIHSSDLRLKMKTNGIRILLDIINKAFEYERDDVLSMEFDTTVRAIRSWVKEERIFPEYLITELFNNMIKSLEYNLSRNAKKEIAVLVEIIMRGSSNDIETFKRLFRDGSKYVRGEDFHSDLEII